MIGNVINKVKTKLKGIKTMGNFWMNKGSKKEAKKIAKMEAKGIVVPETKTTTYQYYTRPTVPVPTDTVDRTKLSIFIVKQSTLNAISDICQPAAGSSEFQVHYRAFIARVKTKDTEFIVTIPTAFYNFTQQVTGSAVDYHLDNVDKEADSVKSISDAKVTEIFKQFPMIAALQGLFPDATVVFEESNSGSMHRHPGRFGFSSTDYSKTPSNPGVIYREAEATDKVHTDSVLFLAGTRTEIFTTETRILNIAPKDNGVEGTYCQIPTITYILKDTDTTNVVANEEKTAIEELLGGFVDGSTASSDNNDSFYVGTTMGAKKGYQLVNEILEDFINADYTPDLSNVVADRITPKYASYARATTGGGYTGGYTGAQSLGYYDAWDDVWDDDYRYGWGNAERNVQKTQTPVTTTVHKQASSYNPYPRGSELWKQYENKVK